MLIEMRFSNFFSIKDEISIDFKTGNINTATAKELTDKSCSGFSLVYYDDVSEKYVTNSYINCSKYTTDGYSDYK